MRVSVVILNQDGNRTKGPSKINIVFFTEQPNRSKTATQERGMAILAMLGPHGQDARATVFTVSSLDNSQDGCRRDRHAD